MTERSGSIDWVVVGGPLERWTQLGLVAAGRRIPLLGTGLEVTGEGEAGMRGWIASGIDRAVADVDGVVTTVSDSGPPLFAEHPLGAASIDHVVVATDDLARTCGAIADAFAAPLKRVRELGEIRQGFHRIGGSGGLIVEVVERAGTPPGPARLWGFVLTVDDLDAACALLGPDVVAEPRDAVQPGRRIATIRADTGLGIPLALMSPDIR